MRIATFNVNGVNGRLGPLLDRAGLRRTPRGFRIGH